MEVDAEEEMRIKKNFNIEEDLDQGWSVFQPPSWCKGHPSSMLENHLSCHTHHLTTIPHPTLIALTALIVTVLPMQASLEAPLRLVILDYYSLYIRTQSST